MGRARIDEVVEKRDPRAADGSLGLLKGLLAAGRLAGCHTCDQLQVPAPSRLSSVMQGHQ